MAWMVFLTRRILSFLLSPTFVDQPFTDHWKLTLSHKASGFLVFWLMNACNIYLFIIMNFFISFFFFKLYLLYQLYINYIINRLYINYLIRNKNRTISRILNIDTRKNVNCKFNYINKTHFYHNKKPSQQ